MSKKSEYALLALAFLARRVPEQTANAREIAEQSGVPLELCAKILQTLGRARLIVSTSGPTGGYRLARPARDISIAQILTAIDGPTGLTPCMKEAGACHHSPRCTIKTPLTRMNERILQILALTTLAEISGETATSNAIPLLPIRDYADARSETRLATELS